MSEQNRPRWGVLVAVAAAAALLGGLAALGIGTAAGWLGSTETVVLESADAGANGTPASNETSPPPLTGERFDAAAVYRERATGVVTIYSLFPGHGSGTPAGQSQGSGFVVSPDGYVLTNSHVITTAGEEPNAPVVAAEQVFVEFRDGDRAEAKIVGWDLFNDTGVLKVDPTDHQLAPVPLGDSAAVVVGEPVAAIGSPFGQSTSLAVGVVSATERSVESLTSAYNLVDAIQTDAPINRGNSGGPLFNSLGEVIGINAQIRSDSGNAEGVGFAVPINSARRSMEQLIETGQVRYAWLGVATTTLTPSVARELGLSSLHGAAIESVVPGSPAEQAGLRGGNETVRVEGADIRAGGDVVVAVNGARVASSEDLVRIVAGRLFPGQTARFTILRGGERVIVPVELAERPANPDTQR